MAFVHLHVHSPFSFLDGASSIPALVQRAAELEMPALAITDHNNVSAAVQFYKTAAAAGIKPIQGAELTLENGHHLTCLAENSAGYANLCRLLTSAYQHGNRLDPRVPFQALSKYNKGLIFLSGCRRGEVPFLMLQGKADAARAAANRYLKICGRDHFYIELTSDFLPHTAQLNRALAELAAELRLKVVAANNVHYAEKSGFPLHDTLTCIRTLTRLEDVHPERRLNAENYLKSPAEMRQLFTAYPEALAATLEIAERCQPALDLQRPLFPAFPVPQGKPAAVFLRELTYEGAMKRYGTITSSIRQRLEHELDIITRLQVEDYFLAMWDIACFAREQGIRYAGRGSAADSAVVYCLGITEVDAIARGLLFERFLSLERAQKPDIDIDFDARCRDEVAKYVYGKYGEEHVASVCTFNTFRARSALRDFGKALGFSPEEVNSLAKRFPHVPADAITAALDKFPELRRTPVPMWKYRQLFDLCEKAAGFPRFIGTHLGGLVICREPLTAVTPLQPAAKGVLITQFDKDDVEELGLIKLDLLSLRTLSAVEDAVASINSQAGPSSSPGFCYEKIPLDDEATYRRLNSGKTIGAFQLESPAQRALQARLGAENMEDIIASVALIRPGPIKGNMVEPFIARRRGQEEPTYIHPALERILAKTYGVVLYQEQVIQIATEIAGFTPGESDRLRRVMTHFRSQKEMDAIGREFIAKAAANGVEQDVAKTIFSYIVGYAGYGFCEAHAAAFGDTAYKTSYLLEHYPAHFYAAILSNQPMGFYPPNTICLEARRRNIPILPPDINISTGQFTVEELPSGGNGKAPAEPRLGIRVSLAQVAKMDQTSLRKILSERAKAPYRSLMDFCLRAQLDKDITTNLILCGAFDALHPNRRQLLWDLDKILELVTGGHQLSLFSGELPDLLREAGPQDVPDFSPKEKFLQEYAVLGFNVSSHLMAFLRPYLKQRRAASSRQLEQMAPGKKVCAAGIVIRPHRPPTKSGRTVVFLTLEDEFGMIDVTVFEDVYHKYGHIIFTEPALLAWGTLEQRGNAKSITARRVEALPLSVMWRQDNKKA
ncbi:MAG: DNA polymerase III subunit alpha [Firmicutes bacterium]|nr:DNA polymerase III subunit alpha [Bacillota bacterium]